MHTNVIWNIEIFLDITFAYVSSKIHLAVFAKKDSRYWGFRLEDTNRSVKHEMGGRSSGKNLGIFALEWKWRGLEVQRVPTGFSLSLFETSGAANIISLDVTHFVSFK